MIRTRPAFAQQPKKPPSQRATGTVRRSDLPRRTRGQAGVGWPLFTVGLVIGAIAVAWMLGAGRSQPIAGATSSPLTGAVSSPSPSGSPAHPSPTGAQPTAAPTAEPSPKPTRRPTSEPTSEPTPPPSPPTAFSIVFPTDGEILHDRQFNVVGTGPPGATVTHDIPLAFDDHVTIQADGTWLMPVSLGEGNNTLRFRIGDDRATEWAISVVYAPGG